MIYAGFGKRFLAGLVDGVVLLPVMIFSIYFDGFGREVAMATVIFGMIVFSMYHIWMHGRYGATVGKVALKIKVVRNEDGGNISYWDAVKRQSVFVLFGIFGVASGLYALSRMSSGEYFSLGWMDRQQRLGELAPFWSLWVVIGEQIWVLGELAVLLGNGRRRAIHDFIAGTAVVVRQSVEDV